MPELLLLQLVLDTAVPFIFESHSTVINITFSFLHGFNKWGKNLELEDVSCLSMKIHLNLVILPRVENSDVHKENYDVDSVAYILVTVPD